MDHAQSTADERLEQLSAWLDGELDEAAQAAVATHIGECEECQAVLADLHAVRALLHTLPAPTLPRSFELPEDLPMRETPARVLPEPVVAVRSSPRAAPPSAEAVSDMEEPLALPTSGEREAAFIAPEPAATAPHSRRPARWIRVVQQVGGLAAVVGLVLLLSSAILGQGAEKTPSNAASSRMPANTSVTSGDGQAGTSAPTQHANSAPPNGSNAHTINGGTDNGAAAVAPPLGVVLGLAFIAMGIVLLLGGVFARRHRGTPPQATAPPGA